MLAEAGIQDEAWLQAVRLHHELPDGSGYPAGTSESSELAEMLRFADVYTARLSDRADRPAISARQAGRELHQMAAASPLAGALIKAFGIFPPGSVVRLVSGEMGIVVRNGEKAYHPHVAILTTAAASPACRPAGRHLARQPCGVGPAAGPCHADADQRGNDRRPDRRGLSRPEKARRGRAFSAARATQGVGVATT
jgi:hypothetical protein